MYVGPVWGWDILLIAVLGAGLAGFLIRLQSTGALRVLRRCRTDPANAGIIAFELAFLIYASIRSTQTTRWVFASWTAAAYAMAYIMIRTIQKLERDEAALARAKASGEFKCPNCGAQIKPAHTLWCPHCASELPPEFAKALWDAIGEPQPEKPPPGTAQPPGPAA
jgi:predicted RNA-binding Zn-ribbon protein involved in translation (DUF1610 family)